MIRMEFSLNSIKTFKVMKLYLSYLLNYFIDVNEYIGKSLLMIKKKFESSIECNSYDPFLNSVLDVGGKWSSFNLVIEVSVIYASVRLTNGIYCYVISPAVYCWLILVVFHQYRSIGGERRIA